MKIRQMADGRWEAKVPMPGAIGSSIESQICDTRDEAQDFGTALSLYAQTMLPDTPPDKSRVKESLQKLSERGIAPNDPVYSRLNAYLKDRLHLYGAFEDDGSEYA